MMRHSALWVTRPSDSGFRAVRQDSPRLARNFWFRTAHPPIPVPIICSHRRR
jgi:hypothetical protein